MISSWFMLFLLIFASFRLTRLLVYDKITNFLRKPFHEEIEEIEPDGSKQTYIIIKGKGIRRWIGELLSCYWCTGIWCAAILYLGWVFFPTISIYVISILTIAGCASIVETLLSPFLDR
ncbi:DUF1360 domain-containing protein [Heyndrickxia ginsengihumi]|uniref:DUF1360 domain-containing protein n=1 Tax=Heyndrickxia ginsengihumi TaxID=363870 RepID=A0A0A6VC68_9BACI|nr:DUF1360 domain-containing protein [Heyndrickxia ginsengihumi]KHD85176.1 sporulation protein [Heyndrickxia ginsengihumi]MBE6185620.1 DUF1360 domain-containing protein [Bacillus sp. (in: firmicutes)]MCM3025134.1 DUF1360 domain-containing protein [Heyndrickxia ginsengihumi]NEY18800.1 DUF1360 domain-containing protein [Heyndrickxia ginsengihumi]